MTLAGWILLGDLALGFLTKPNQNPVHFRLSLREKKKSSSYLFCCELFQPTPVACSVILLAFLNYKYLLQLLRHLELHFVIVLAVRV